MEYDKSICQNKFYVEFAKIPPKFLNSTMILKRNRVKQSFAGILTSGFSPTAKLDPLALPHNGMMVCYKKTKTKIAQMQTFVVEILHSTLE